MAVSGKDSKVKQDQRRIALELTEGLEDMLIKSINKCPDEWDGFEIRQLAFDILRANFLTKPLTGQRKRQYKNECIINNLY